MKDQPRVVPRRTVAQKKVEPIPVPRRRVDQIRNEPVAVPARPRLEQVYKPIPPAKSSERLRTLEAKIVATIDDRQSRFDQAMDCARTAIQIARTLSSLESIQTCFSEIKRQIWVAVSADEQSRDFNDILTLCGISWSELVGLRDQFYQTVTYAVDGTCSKRLLSRRSSKIAPIEDRLLIRDKPPVSIIYFGGKPVQNIDLPNVPIGAQIDIFQPVIIYPKQEKYGSKPALRMQDDRYAGILEVNGRMQRIMTRGLLVLMSSEFYSDFGWVYYPLDSEGYFNAQEPLLGSCRNGFYREPAVKQSFVEMLRDKLVADMLSHLSPDEEAQLNQDYI